MFLAHVFRYEKNNSANSENLTFTCQPHAISELITLIARYQKLYNELNEVDCVFQLLHITDCGQSLPLSTITNLGAVELSRQILSELKNQRLQKMNSKRIELLPVEVVDTVEDEDEKFIRGFNLPKLTEIQPVENIKLLHPIPRTLMQRNQLWLVTTETGIMWRLEAGKRGSVVYTEGQIDGPCFLVENGPSYYLSPSNPLQNEGQNND